MKVLVSCLPAHEPFLPKPVLAGGALPGWLRDMPARATSDVLDGAEVRTVKQCPPFVDAMRAGILFPLACDLRVANGELSWDWALPDAGGTRSPVGLHVPEQTFGVPGARAGDFAVKFTNFWTVALPPGWSMLFGHPANREDLPFRTLSGLVDCDAWSDGHVHFPALWTDAGFEGTLPAGTPVAQGWPVRREPLELECGTIEDATAHDALREALDATPGLYRGRYRAARS